LAQIPSTKRRAVTIHPPARLVDEPKKTKKRKEGRKEGRKEDTQTVANWLFAQTAHVVGSKWNFAWWVGCGVKLYLSSVIQIGQGVTALCGVGNGPSLLLWPAAYTTACTTVQAVIPVKPRNRDNIKEPIAK